MSPLAKRRLRRTLEETIKIGIGAGLLGLLWHRGLIDPLSLGRSIATHPVLAVLAIGSQGLLFLFLANRWMVLARPSHLSIPLSLASRLTLTSHFFSTCLPGNGAGDLVKGWIFSRRGLDFGMVLGTMILDRVIGMAGLFLSWSVFLSIAIATHPDSAGLLLPFLVMAVVVAASLLATVTFSRRIDDWLQRLTAPKNERFAGILQFLRRTVRPVSKGATAPGSIAVALTLSLAIQLCYVATVWLAGRILSIQVGVVTAGAVLPLVSLVNAIPLSPGGVGVGETVGAAAMREFGLQQNAGAQVVLAARFASIFWALAGAACYLSFRTKAPDEISPIER